MRLNNLSFVRIAAIAAIVLAVGTPVLMANQSSQWEVVVATNASMTQGSNQTARIMTIGASVTSGDRLTTGPGGALVLSRGEDLITMAENTQISIVDPQPVDMTLIQEPYGMAQYHVTKGPVPHFEVDTPLLATVVKGTTFSVAANSAQGAVAVSEGRVVARRMSNGASASVSTGEVGRVARDQSGVNVHPGKLTETDISGATAGGPGASTTSTTDGDDSSSGASSNAGGSGNGKSAGKSNGKSSSSGSGSGSSNGNGKGNNGNGNGNGGSNGNNGNGKGNGGRNGNNGGNGYGNIGG